MKRSLGILRRYRPEGNADIVERYCIMPDYGDRKSRYNSADRFRSSKSGQRRAKTCDRGGTVLSVGTSTGSMASAGGLMVQPQCRQESDRQATSTGMVTMPGVFTADGSACGLARRGASRQVLSARCLVRSGHQRIRAVLQGRSVVAVAGRSTMILPPMQGRQSEPLDFGSSMYKAVDASEGCSAEARGDCALMRSTEDRLLTAELIAFSGSKLNARHLLGKFRLCIHHRMAWCSISIGRKLFSIRARHQPCQTSTFSGNGPACERLTEWRQVMHGSRLLYCVCHLPV